MNCCHELCPLHTQRFRPGKVTSKIIKTNKVQGLHSPQWPLDSPRDPGNYLQHQISISFQFPPPDYSTKSASASNFYHQATAPNQLPVSTTRQQHKISFQFLPPGSSTKPATSFYHQATAPHQPASSKAFSQSAVNSTSLPHPHDGSQVCHCLDIL